METQQILFLLDCEECRGPFNFSGPQLVRQKEFARQLGRVLHRPAFLPVPGLVMKLGLGEFGRSLLQGQKVPPRALTERGFQFLHPELEPALRDLLHD